MKRLFAAVVLVGCGSHMKIPDAGPDEDAGVDAGVPDAGRAKGEDPPSGWTVALATPGDAGMLARYGVSATMALDQFGQPMIAALIVDPNSDGVLDDNRLVFTRWNGVTKAYQDPVTVEIVGDIDVSHPNRQVSLARDATTGQLAIAYVKSGGHLRRAWSDDEGAHWSKEDIDPGTIYVPSNPVIAMNGGTTRVAYDRVCVSGSCSQVALSVRGDAGTYDDQIIGFPLMAIWPISMAVSSTGVPSVAFFVSNTSDGGTDAGITALVYTQSGAALSVITSKTVQIDKTPSVTLTLEGDVPRVAYHLPSDTNPDAEVFYAQAADATGMSWSLPLALPRNGPAGMLDGTQWYQAVSGSTVVANFQHRTAVSAQQCGGPKFWTSATDGSMPCHPPESGGVLVHTFDFAGWWITMAPHKTGKMTIAMDYEPRTNPLIGAGVVVYRQP